MLTADLVRTRAKGGELTVLGLTAKTRPRALELAERFLGIVRAHEGTSVGELKEAFRGVQVGPREKKLALGLVKLIEDRVDFDTPTGFDPRKFRSVVFAKAAEQRRADPHVFDRERILLEAAGALGRADIDAASLETALFCDLKSEQRVGRLPPLAAETLLEQYDIGQIQAVFLRATRVSAHVRCTSVPALRALFRALKFRRLLFEMHKEGDGYRIEIDGPFSLFDSVTKYGVQLALVFPALLDCDQLNLVADVRWGKARTPLVFRFEQKSGARGDIAPELAPECVELARRINDLGGPWRAEPNTTIVDLPGIGVVIPDLALLRDGQRVLFELLGFWSREAVWKRVELAQRGLPAPMIFGVSERLRVSEAVLDDVASAALHVFKGTPNPKKILDSADAVARLAAKARTGTP